MLSIIVPAYNVENYIEQCVESIRKQSYTDFELILVDDGSTDRTGNICDTYAEKDSRITVVHKQNGGLVSARKAGLRVALGEYVAYVDGDDWIASDMFEKLYACACKENADVVISDFVSVCGGKETLLTQNMKWGLYDKCQLADDVYPYMLCREEYFSFGFQPSLCSKLFKKTLLTKFQYEVNDRIRLGEDAACVYPLLLEAESIFYLKEYYFYYYRMRETSISHAIVSSYYTEEILLLLNHIEKQFNKFQEKCDLNRELCLYGCYMLDNMITPHLTFRELLFNNRISIEMRLFAHDLVGNKVVEYCKNVRTSSKMKRVLGLISGKSAYKVINLYLFVKYERILGRINK